LGFELSDVVEVSRSYHVDNMKTYRILVREWIVERNATFVFFFPDFFFKKNELY
jgi:hypothetical protein